MRMRKVAVVLLALMMIGGCSPTQPTPPPLPPGTTITVTVPGNGNTINVGDGNGIGPSPSPSGGPFVKPDYVKITMYGDEKCGNGTNGQPILPANQSRTVRVGCTVALTISPKCHQPNGLPDVDCPVPDGAAPDAFEATTGREHILFVPQGDNPKFNRNATGVSAGLTTITGSYAGVRVADDFVLTVIQ